jgi:hypothetical protein
MADPATVQAHTRFHRWPPEPQPETAS